MMAKNVGLMMMGGGACAAVHLLVGTPIGWISVAIDIVSGTAIYLSFGGLKEFRHWGDHH